MFPRLKGNDRNAALKVMLVRLFSFFCLSNVNAHFLYGGIFFFVVQQLISSLHDICQYLCAHARLGSSHARLGSQKLEFSGVTADWGGTEGIGKLSGKCVVSSYAIASANHTIH